MRVASEALRNGIVFIGVCVVYFIYMRLIANTLPDSWGGEFNVIVVPFLIGVVCAFAFVGRLLLKIALLVAAAAFVLLIISGGGDPAKPGLHLWVIAAELLIASLGMLCAAFVNRLLRSRTPT